MRERLGGSPPAAAPIKLVVLPFENLTGDPEQEYFSDGLTEEMITQLGRLHPQGLNVIARTSSIAMQLDPLNALVQAFYGVDLYFVRRYDDAIRWLQSAPQTSPDLPFAHCVLANAFNVKGQPEKAMEGAQRCPAHYGRDVQDALMRGYSEAGYAGAMRQVGDLLSKGGSGTYVPAIDVFAAYIHAGEKDLALQWLLKAVDARDPNLYGAVRDPFVVDSVAGDPRFREILRRTRLPI